MNLLDTNFNGRWNEISRVILIRFLKCKFLPTLRIGHVYKIFNMYRIPINSSSNGIWVHFNISIIHIITI